LRLHDFVRDITAKWQQSVEAETATVDWCFAENLAYASLLDDGHSVRISGMDVGRGTFMHRHAVWHSQGATSGATEPHVPLQNLGVHQGEFDIINSPLTEEAVLGFEYGYSVQSTSHLAIWEAQFGDFVNGAQVIIDQYIAAGEYKWGQPSGLTMLLPHGHEGVGPEHSSAYLSRFLQLCAGGNMKVVMPSTSSQWFHMLREQALSVEPKPLVVMSPKGQLHVNAFACAAWRVDRRCVCSGAARQWCCVARRRDARRTVQRQVFPRLAGGARTLRRHADCARPDGTVVPVSDERACARARRLPEPCGGGVGPGRGKEAWRMAFRAR